MDQTILVAVEHGLDELLEKHLGLVLGESAFLLDVGEELAALEVLHDYSHLHVLQGQAVVHLYDVVVAQAF